MISGGFTIVKRWKITLTFIIFEHGFGISFVKVVWLPMCFSILSPINHRSTTWFHEHFLLSFFFLTWYLMRFFQNIHYLFKFKLFPLTLFSFQGNWRTLVLTTHNVVLIKGVIVNIKTVFIGLLPDTDNISWRTVFIGRNFETEIGLLFKKL